MPDWFRDGGRVDSIAIDDRGLQYGDGLFETIAIRKGEPRLWPLHLTRLQTGCRRLGIDAPADELLTSGARDAISASGNSGKDALLKIIVTRGAGARGYAPPPDAAVNILFGVFERTEHPDDCYRQGITVRICNTRLSMQPQTAGMKLLARMDQILARAEWQDSSIHEGLMLDQQGMLVCGTMSNVFVVVGETLLTPRITHCGVAGIMRQHILALGQQNGVALDVVEISTGMIQAASEIFVCNSQIGIWPVVRCGSKQLAAGPLTRGIMQLLHDSGVHEGPL